METLAFQKFNSLPLDLRQEVLDFIEFLLQKHQQKIEQPQPVGKRPSTFGNAKGKIYMAPDFNEIPEEFKEYIE
ncbi:MAG: DUF2281 domain-containing protein [Bacteroidota bacterium]